MFIVVVIVCMLKMIHSSKEKPNHFECIIWAFVYDENRLIHKTEYEMSYVFWNICLQNMICMTTLLASTICWSYKDPWKACQMCIVIWICLVLYTMYDTSGKWQQYSFGCVEPTIVCFHALMKRCNCHYVCKCLS